MRLTFLSVPTNSKSCPRIRVGTAIGRQSLSGTFPSCAKSACNTISRVPDTFLRQSLAWVMSCLIVSCSFNVARADESSARTRYESLKKWSLPTASRPSIRSVATTVVIRNSHVEHDGNRVASDPALALTTESVTSVWLLAEAARDAGELDELLKLVRPLADKNVENAKPLLQLIQIARGEGAKWEPQFQQFVRERQTAWSKPVEANSNPQRVSPNDIFIAKAALGDPWLVVRSTSGFSGWVRNLRIKGNPTIPTEINLLAGSDLSNWLDVYYQNPPHYEPVPNGAAQLRPYWERNNDTIIGARLNNNFRESQTETVLQYHRPLAEDGEIEYEFYYASKSGPSNQPNQRNRIVVHPALDRLTFMLGPDGVAVHWMTDGQFESNGALPGNLVVEQENRRGPAALPLKDNEWNRLKLSLRGNVVALALNGEEVYERSLEPTNQRSFGLFRYADDSESRIRNIVYRGNWPMTLPKVEDQELAANINRLVHFEPREVPAMRRWNFRGERPKWIIPTFDEKKFSSLTKETKDGLILSLPPGRTLPGDVFGFETSGQYQGDIEVTTKFKILRIERSNRATSFKVPGVDIGVTLNSSAADLLRMERRLFEPSELGHAIKAVHRWTLPNQTFSYDIERLPWPAMSGRMKLVRKGPRLMYLFADEDSDRWQLIHQTPISQDDAIRPTVLVRNFDQESDISILFQDWLLRATRIVE